MDETGKPAITSWVVTAGLVTGATYPVASFDDWQEARTWADAQPRNGLITAYVVGVVPRNPVGDVLADGRSVWRLDIGVRGIQATRHPASDLWLYHLQPLGGWHDPLATQKVYTLAVDESDAIQQALAARTRWQDGQP